MIRFRRYAAVSLGLLAAVAIASPANAQDRAAQDLGEELVCSSDQWAAGLCITAMWSEGEDPIAEGVKQALARGEDAQVQTFTDERAKSCADDTQVSIEGLIAGTVPNDQGRDGDAARAGGNDGYTLGGLHIIDEQYFYGQCTPNSPTCTVGGSMITTFYLNIYEYSDVWVDGGVGISTGNTPVKYTEILCETWWDSGFPFLDQNVHTWQNCADAETTTFWGSYRTIIPTVWNQGGGNGETYHNFYSLRFVIQGTSNPVGRDWTTQSYKVLVGGGASFNY